LAHDAIIDFWFREIKPQQWWRKDDDFDRVCRDRFGDMMARAAAGELWGWRETASGRLAEVLLLDQFPRNVHRNTPLAFATDGMALVLAQEAVRAGADRELENAQQRAFLYMPYMHSESKTVHEDAVRLFSGEGMDPNNLDFELRHKRIIDQFGRYPHRNEILGRASTVEEEIFLERKDSGF